MKVLFLFVCLAALPLLAQTAPLETLDLTSDSIPRLADSGAVAADTLSSVQPSLPALQPAQAPISPSLEASAETRDEAPGETVIEVDQRQSKNASKSLPIAMLCSALLPGSGEYYLEDKGPGKVFLLVEAGFWASLYIAFLAQDSYLQSSRNFASEFSGIEAGNKSVNFLNTMASYRSYQEKQHRQDSYELSQILSGKRDRDYAIPMSPENDWDFGSSTNPQNTRNWKTFQSTLRYYRSSKVAVSFAVGALALNRLASIAHTLNVFKRTSAKRLGLQVLPEFGSDYAGARLSFGI
jgi:hypothetical protein